MSSDVRYLVMWGDGPEVEKTRAEIEAEFDRVFGGDSWRFLAPAQDITGDFTPISWFGDCLHVTISDATDEWWICDLSFGGWCAGSGDSIESAYRDLIRSIRTLQEAAGQLADEREAAAPKATP